MTDDLEIYWIRLRLAKKGCGIRHKFGNYIGGELCEPGNLCKECLNMIKELQEETK